MGGKYFVGINTVGMRVEVEYTNKYKKVEDLYIIKGGSYNYNQVFDDVDSATTYAIRLGNGLSWESPKFPIVNMQNI